MSRRRDETDQQWMVRVRAARAYCNIANQNPGLEYAAFMDLFHPEQDRVEVALTAHQISRAHRDMGGRG